MMLSCLVPAFALALALGDALVHVLALAFALLALALIEMPLHEMWQLQQLQQLQQLSLHLAQLQHYNK